ncbi:MAG: ArsC/Spx/MgsR family protein [Synechococcales bacterium]|nr:ArsC/Spx/MgsR family protein [Synechococcales bacterium]
MATILFYEKPGCINNTRQKALLLAAGHQVVARNLLTESWTVARLQQFFGDRPVASWFNASAPRVKSGTIVPEALDAATALQLMVADPLLIRRPLMQVGERYEVGFEVDRVEAWVGLRPASDRTPAIYAHLRQQDLQTCLKTLNPCK